MKVQSKILAVTILGNLIGSVIVFIYFAYIDIFTYLMGKAFWRGAEADWSAVWYSLTLALIAVTFFVTARARKLAEVETAVSEGTSIDTFPETIKRQAAEFPLYTAGFSWLMWILIALYFGLGARNFGMTDAPTFARVFLGIAVVGGLTTSVLVFLFVDWFWRPQIKHFFPEGHIRETKARSVSVGLRLAATFILTGLVPLIILGMAAHNSASNVMAGQIMAMSFEPSEVLSQLQLTVYFIVGLSLVTNVALSYMSTRTLLDPLRKLNAAMDEVGEDADFTRRVPIESHDEIGDLTDNFNTMLGELGQGQRMRDLFGRYVSKEVAAQVLEDGADLGGVNSHATALFADIRNFTSMTEKLSPEQTVDILNRYYTKMVDVVVEEGGIVNKFGGDSLLAIFGVPIRQPDHPLRAVRAAWNMNRAMAEFNAEQASLGQPQITIGIGIASGEVMAGNIGGTARMEYTIIGDPVNLASRLQDLTKEYKKPILVSQETAHHCQHAADLSSMGHVSIKGKAEQVHVYELNKVGV